MSGFTPIALSFTPFDHKAEDLGPRVFAYLDSAHDFDSTKIPLARLVFDTNSGDWTGTEAIAEKGGEIGSVLATHQWIRGNGALRIGEWSHSSEIYFYPLSNEDKRPCCEIKLHSSAYESVYEFTARGEGEFNENAKMGLLQLCFGLSAVTEPACFAIRFDDGDLRALNLEEVMRCLRSPEMSSHGKRPGLITGVRQDIVSRDELKSIWGEGEEVYQTTLGYVVLDLLQPSKASGG